MPSSVDAKRLFVIGAHSLVGRLMRKAWTGGPVTWCARDGAADVSWSLNQGSAALSSLLEGSDAVLCLAGATPGAQDFDLNKVLGEAVVHAAQRAGCKQVLLASSMAVYGASGSPFSENAPCAPVGEYGRSKLAMEQTCLGVSGVPGVTALRLGNVVGADMLFRNIAAGHDIDLDQFPDGATPARSYIDPVHLAQVIDALVGRTLPPRLNIAAAPAVQMGDLATAAGVVWTGRPAPTTALPIVEMNLTALHQITGPKRVSGTAMVEGWRKAVEAGT